MKRERGANVAINWNDLIHDVGEHHAQLRLELDKFRGAKVRITSDYNGQLYGRSKHSLTGLETTIRHAYFDDLLGLGFFLNNPRCECGLRFSEVEFL